MTAAQRDQIVAARPSASSWVAANAGSGKTRVLTDRVARLLLAGTEPSKILCLTYTKAAAAEMQTRLFRTLGAWAMMPEAELRAALSELGEEGAAIPTDRLDRARTLFARALETPGGLKIQTIHAFCDALLRRFPLEAEVSPQFAVLEDRQARALRAEVLDALVEAGSPEFADIARHLPDDDLDRLLQEIGRHRGAFAGPFDPAALAAGLGAEPGLTRAALTESVLAPGAPAMLRALVPLLAAGSTNDQRCAAPLAAALAGPQEALLEALEDLLLCGAGAAAPFTSKAGKFPTKATRARNPALMAELDALAARVEAGRTRRLGLLAFEKSEALHRFARVWLRAWAARKAALGLLDFDDLVDRARGLLARQETAAWVLWRLDGGLDHILVDEAQDTSPAQWQVIEAISAEFFAGRGAREAPRTIFVVGDEKQSIYSFQGADPAAFGTMREGFDRLLAGIDSALARCDLLYSFRSAAPILRLVDAVFAGAAGAGLAGRVEHKAFSPEAPGRVELWPFLERPDKPEEVPWDTPLDMPPPDDPVRRLAQRVAATIRGWLDARRALPGAGDGRAIRAGDVLILVQRRGPVFDAVIRELKRAGVPVAGADVLRIGAELAVKDLLAALRVAATPQDDLSLAALLRSPLGGWSEAELFRLAHPRGARTLWEALNAAEPAPPIRDVLRDLRGQADFLRPFELLQRLLVRHGGRHRLIARLGPEAEDGVDALLDQAIAYESVEPPTLTGFLAWIDRDEVTVKRRMEEAADEVRVMTVHGAKGLEAPIVILPDTALRSEAANPPQLLRMGERVVWRARGADCPPQMAAAEAARRDQVSAENRRLLYVALTRAKTWLIVAGAGKAGERSWHAMVQAALESLGAREAPAPEGGALALDHNWTEAPGAARGAATGAALPDWARRAPPAPPPDAPPLSPSGLGGAHSTPGEGADEAEARAYGTALHLLLETLPRRPGAEWPALAARLLPGVADPSGLLADAAAVLGDPALAELFGAGALAEVDVTAALPALGGRRILGRIDRLLVRPDRVLAVDFKSNRAVPETPEATPEGVLRQMGAYAAALAALWPGRRVETAVLWTRRRRLMPLPPALTAAALLRGAQLDPAGGRP